MLNRVLSLIAVALSITALIFCLTGKKSSKTGYVDISRMLMAYQLKNDMESREQSRLDELEKQADSLKAVYQFLVQSAQSDKQKLQLIETKVSYLIDERERLFEAANLKINEAIWKRLNSDIKEFGDLNGYKIIWGANGMGSILYGSTEEDLTEKLTDYVNQKYRNEIR